MLKSKYRIKTDGTNTNRKVSYEYYNADSDRTVTQNRVNAIKHIIDTKKHCTIASIRYSGGYYSTCIIPYSENYAVYYILEVIQINSSTYQFNLFAYTTSTASVTFIKTII